MKHISRRFIVMTACTAAVGALAVPAAAAEPDWELALPAGVACTFPLTISGVGSSPVVKEFPARDGVVRLLLAGRGSENTYTNMDTLASMTSKANGSVISTRTEADGSSTSVLTGHTVVIMFPTDVPAGPSTTLYTGRVVTKVDAAGISTIVSEAGRGLDICAALTPAG